MINSAGYFALVWGVFIGWLLLTGGTAVAALLRRSWVLGALALAFLLLGLGISAALRSVMG